MLLLSSFALHKIPKLLVLITSHNIISPITGLQILLLNNTSYITFPSKLFCSKPPKDTFNNLIVSSLINPNFENFPSYSFCSLDKIYF